MKRELEMEKSEDQLNSIIPFIIKMNCFLKHSFSSLFPSNRVETACSVASWQFSPYLPQNYLVGPPNAGSSVLFAEKCRSHEVPLTGVDPLYLFLFFSDFFCSLCEPLQGKERVVNEMGTEKSLKPELIRQLKDVKIEKYSWGNVIE